MPKNKGGRFYAKPRFKYSPHPTEALRELRSLGITESQIRNIRKTIREYREVENDIISYNVSHYITSHTAAPTYETIAARLRSGHSLQEQLTRLRYSKKYFEETGSTLDLKESLLDDVSFINEEIGADIITEEDIANLDANSLEKLQKSVDKLKRYKDNKSSNMIKDGYKVDDAVNQTIEQILDVFGIEV